MKGFGFLCLFLLIGTATFMYLGYSSKGRITSNPESDAMRLMWKSRKLKDNNGSDRDDAGYFNLEDYRPINPVPSSKASIRPGPVQHGTPLMPYIPKPSPPPGQPEHGG